MTSTLIPSGLPEADARWGGLPPGTLTALVGRAAAGRTRLALQVALAAADAGAVCVLLSPRAPADLLVAAPDLPLREAGASGRLKPMTMPAAEALAAGGPDALDGAWASLAGLLRAQRPARLVVEDAAPMTQYDDPARFAAALRAFAEAARETGTAVVLGLGDPAHDDAARLLEALLAQADAHVRLDPTPGAPLRLYRAWGTPAPEPEPTAPSPEAQPAPVPHTLPAPMPASAGDGAAPIPTTALVPPDLSDPALTLSESDLSSLDLADELFRSGYLVDSRRGVGVPAAAPAPEPAAEADAESALRNALAACFSDRERGQSFAVVAMRMDPSAPESAHFPAVAEGARAALGPADALLADEARRRLIAVLPQSSAAASQALFVQIQNHLRRTLGPGAEATFRAIAAVTISDGQPFETAEALFDYAFAQ